MMMIATITTTKPCACRIIIALLLLLATTNTLAQVEAKEEERVHVVEAFQQQQQQHDEWQERRQLRGGSYSRNSGGSSSYNRGGSSGGWNRNRNNNNRMNRNRNRNGGMSTMGRIMGGLALATIGMMLLGMMFPAAAVGCCPCFATLLCCGLGAVGGAAAASSAAAGGNNNYGSNNYSAYGNNHNDYNDYNDYNNNNFGGGFGSSTSKNSRNEAFENQVRQAKEGVESHARTNSSSMNNQPQPQSGQYTSSFVDPGSGVTHKVAMYLMFTPSPHHPPGCYSISGQGNDIDGTTVIEEGLLTPDGMAWWRERTLTGDVGLLLLSRGKFSFRGPSSTTFQGTWLASSGVGGSYLSFTTAGFASTQQHHDAVASTTTTTPLVVITPVEITGMPISDHHGEQQQDPSNYKPPVVVMGQPIS